MAETFGALVGALGPIDFDWFSLTFAGGYAPTFLAYSALMAALCFIAGLRVGRTRSERPAESRATRKPSKRRVLSGLTPQLAEAAVYSLAMGGYAPVGAYSVPVMKSHLDGDGVFSVCDTSIGPMFCLSVEWTAYLRAPHRRALLQLRAGRTISEMRPSPSPRDADGEADRERDGGEHQ